MDYAEAILSFGNAVEVACVRADNNGLTAEDQIKELRRIAQEMEDNE